MAGFSSDTMLGVMHEALIQHVRDKLKKDILDALTPDIDAAVDAAAATMKTRLEASKDFQFNELFIKFIVEKR